MDDVTLRWTAVPGAIGYKVYRRPVDPQSFLFARNDLEAAYREWKDTHPGVYALFVRFARERLHQGRRFGIGALTERVRWEVATTWALDPDGFKINNSHRAYLARDLVGDIPALADLIQMRRVRTHPPLLRKERKR